MDGWRERGWPEGTSWREGLGVLCAEGQADGVPCFELGRECEACEKALEIWKEVKATIPMDAEDAPASFQEWVRKGSV
ncbi:MAG TPA: hypothetical protein VGA70_03120 [Longimicrobiales bacterium]|jgi:hypothetical protein